jgi:hypothetical protein
MNEGASVINARLHALLATSREEAAWTELHADAGHRLGADHPLSLRIECERNRYQLAGVPQAAATARWSELAERVRRVLPRHHPTAMAIRTQRMWALSRRGEPGDLDRVVQIAGAELTSRIEAGAKPLWIGAARSDLAAAQLNRARFGAHDPTTQYRDAAADLRAAHDLIATEFERRTVVHGPDDPFTWVAAGIQGSVTAALAERSTPTAQQAMYAEVIALADEIIAIEWHRAGRHTEATLRAQLLRATGLLGLGQDAEAEREARLAAVLARQYPGPAEGRALMLLARALTSRDRPAAQASARRALRVRLRVLSPAAHPVVEARALLAAIARTIQADERALLELLHTSENSDTVHIAQSTEDWPNSIYSR